MRNLTLKQARRCEEAIGKRCRCRCGGALHGARRGGDKTPRTWFEALPEDDPHHIRPKQKRLSEMTIVEMFNEEERLYREYERHKALGHTDQMAAAWLGRLTLCNAIEERITHK